jgi:CHASE3 domain sensor protein
MILIIPVAVLMAMAVASGVGESRATDTEASVDHSRSVRTEIARLLQDITEIESSVRGYLLTATPSLLDPYRAGRDRVDADLERLQVLTADNDEQVASLEHLRQLVAVRFELFDQALIGGPAGQLEGWLPPVEVLERGKAMTDDINVVLGEMYREESRLLTLRTSSEQRARRAVIMIELIGLPLGVVAAIVAGVAFTGGVVRRVRTIEGNAERLSRGESLLPLEPSGDEIGQLGHALDRAAALLAEHSAAVARSVAEIEDLYDNAPCGSTRPSCDGWDTSARKSWAGCACPT